MKSVDVFAVLPLLDDVRGEAAPIAGMSDEESVLLAQARSNVANVVEVAVDSEAAQIADMSAPVKPAVFASELQVVNGKGAASDEADYVIPKP